MCVDDVRVTSRRGEARRNRMDGMTFEAKTRAKDLDLEAGSLACAPLLGAVRNELRFDEPR